MQPNLITDTGSDAWWLALQVRACFSTKFRNTNVYSQCCVKCNLICSRKLSIRKSKRETANPHSWWCHNWHGIWCMMARVASQSLFFKRIKGFFATLVSTLLVFQFCCWFLTLLLMILFYLVHDASRGLVFKRFKELFAILVSTLLDF